MVSRIVLAIAAVPFDHVRLQTFLDLILVRDRGMDKGPPSMRADAAQGFQDFSYEIANEAA